MSFIGLCENIPYIFIVFLLKFLLHHLSFMIYNACICRIISFWYTDFDFSFIKCRICTEGRLLKTERFFHYVEFNNRYMEILLARDQL